MLELLKIRSLFDAIVFLYLLIGYLMIFAIISTQYRKVYYIQAYMVILLYFLFKIFTGYDKCTFSYIEVKLRGVKKEQGYIYRFLAEIVNIKTHPQFTKIFMLVLYYIMFFMLLVNYKIKYMK